MRKLAVYAFLSFVVCVSVIYQTTLAADKPTMSCWPKKNILAHGARLHGANGILFDSEDNLYVCSVAGRQIVKMNSNTGCIIETLDSDQGIEGPDDLAFGPDGSLYWTSFLTGEVGRLAPDGTISHQFVGMGVNPITFSDDGRLFVALDFLGDGLYELDPDLLAPPRFIAGPLGFLNGMDWGPDGHLYGPIWNNGTVVRIDVDADPQDPDFMDVVTDGLDTPAAVKFDKLGRLHVVDQTAGKILRIHPNNGSKKVIARLRPGIDNLAFDARNRLFVTSAHDGFVARVYRKRYWKPISKGGMIGPGGIALVNDPKLGQALFVADILSLRRLHKVFGIETDIARTTLARPGGITSPMTAAPDGGNLILSSWFANNVQVWNPESHEVIKEYSFIPGQEAPLNAIRFEDDIVVAGSISKSVFRISDNFKLAQGLIVPVGLAASDGDLWVSDWATGMVWQIADDGEILSTPHPVASDLSQPEGLAVTADGNLVVVETGRKRVVHIDIQSGRVTCIKGGLKIGVEGITGLPPTYIFNGITVDRHNIAYVAGDEKNLIYRFKIRPFAQ